MAATIGWCDRLERSDLADRLRATAARLSNPSTVMAVVGEFKQGKSQLINALIGRDVCPVDDDLATVAITWLSYRAEELARVRLMRDGDPHIQEVELGQVEQFVAERDNPGNEKQVDLVEIGLP
ncbi:MAG: dynamin family protein, partial [Acidimicrobiia bacterium]|nr:dynamin family protein [Acidimicrobiia bacterium]